MSNIEGHLTFDDNICGKKRRKYIQCVFKLIYVKDAKER